MPSLSKQTDVDDSRYEPVSSDPCYITQPRDIPDFEITMKRRFIVYGFHDQTHPEAGICRNLSGPVPGASVPDRTDSTDRTDVVTDAYPCISVWVFMRLAMGTDGRIYCAAASGRAVRYAGACAGRHRNGI